MDDRIVYGIGETGTWQTGSPTPHVTLDGGVPSGVSIVKRFDEALSSGDVVTVTVRIDADNWSCYGYESGNTGTVGAEFTSGNPDILDFSAAHLLASKGTLSQGDPVEVWVELPEPEPGMEEPADDFNPKLRKTGGGVSTWEASGNAALRNVGTGAGNVAQGDAPGAVQANLDTHKNSGDHDARYFRDGSVISHWTNSVERGGAGTYAHSDVLLLRISNTSSGIVNLTTPALSTIEAIGFEILFIAVAGDVPQWRVNGNDLDLSALPTFATGKAYLLNVLVTSGDAIITCSPELTSVMP